MGMDFYWRRRSCAVACSTALTAVATLQRRAILIRRTARMGDYTPLPYPPRGGCSGSSGISATGAIGTVGKTALAIAPATGPAAPLVLIAGGIASLFSSLFGGHGQKVKQESEILCSAVPAANDTLRQIYTAVQNGQMSPADGSGALDQLVSQFAQAVAPIAKGTFGTSKCNGACLYKGWLDQAIRQCKADFSKMGGSGAGISNTAGGSAEIPVWGYAIGAFLGFSLLLSLTE